MVATVGYDHVAPEEEEVMYMYYIVNICDGDM